MIGETSGRDLVVRVIAVHGALQGSDADVFVEASVDGRSRRSVPALRSAANPGGYEWPVEDGGSLVWSLTQGELRRLQAHEPRVRLSVVRANRGSGKVDSLGFAYFDLRDIAFDRGDSSVRRKSLQDGTQGIPQSTLQFQVTTRMPGILDSVSKQGGEESRMPGDGQAGSLEPTLGVAIGDQHIVIGTSGEFDLTLYITLVSASGLAQLVEKGKKSVAEHLSSNPWAYCLRYHMFGVEIETEPFATLKHAKFAPIRDSFKLRSRTQDVAQFLESSPVRIYLCRVPANVRQATLLRGHQRETQVIASTLLEFDALFSNGYRFAESSSECAFGLEPHPPFVIEPGATYDSGAPSPPPSLVSWLELHVDAKVDKTVLDKGTVPKSPRHATIQTDTLSNDGDSYFRVEVRSLEFNPAEDEEEDGSAGAALSLALMVAARGSEAVSPAKFFRDEYGSMESTPIQGVFLNIRREETDLLAIELRLPSGKVYASGAVVTPRSSPECESSVDLFRGDTGNVCGCVLVKISKLSLGPSSPASGQVQVAQEQEQQYRVQEPVTSIAKSPHLSFTEDDLKPCNYRMTIDLRGIKGLEQREYQAYLQYSYPLFGAVSNVQTRPPILVDRFSERIVPHGLRLFNFVATRAQLVSATQNNPLVVEMWHKDKYAADTRVGFCTLPLRDLLENSRPIFRWGGHTFATLSALELHREKVLAQHEDRSTAEIGNLAGGPLATAQRKAERLRRQIDVPIVHVLALETDLQISAFGHDSAASVQRVATLHCALTLENLGPAKGPKAAALRHNKHKEEAPAKESKLAAAGVDAEESDQGTGDEREVGEPGQVKPEASPRRQAAPESKIESFGTSEQSPTATSLGGTVADRETLIKPIRAAWLEFETWKEAATREWEAEMRTREAVRMSELEQEWATREHGRSTAVKAAQEQYRSLEQRMLRAIADAEKRERSVARLETDLQRAADQRLADLELLARRSREESDHQLAVHKARAGALEADCRRLRAQISAAENRAAKADDAFAAFREKTRAQPEAALHREVASLQGTIAQLHSAVEQEKERTAAERLAREAARQQALHMARELDRLRRDNSARAERQLENLRLEYLAREERYVLDGDRKALLDLKSELNQLRAATLRQPMQSAGKMTQQPPPPPPPPPPGSDQENINSAQLSRLAKERDDLLATGLYGADHPLVQQFDRHIQLAHKNLL